MVELVIRIPEEYYKAIMKIPVNQSTADMLVIKNGTPLPEYHERLIEKINSKKTYKGRVSYSDMHDADMDKIYDIALDKAIEIIRKDCEAESEDM